MIRFICDKNVRAAVSLRAVSKTARAQGDDCLLTQINWANKSLNPSVDEVRKMLISMTAMRCVNPGIKELPIPRMIKYFTEELNRTLESKSELSFMLELIAENLTRKDSGCFFDGCDKVASVNHGEINSWGYRCNTTDVYIGDLKKDEKVYGGVFEKKSLAGDLEPITNGRYAVYSGRKQIFGVSIGKDYKVLASTGVTKTETTTKANGEKVETRWEKVNLGADGIIVASTEVTRIKINF